MMPAPRRAKRLVIMVMLFILAVGDVKGGFLRREFDIMCVDVRSSDGLGCWLL